MTSSMKYLIKLFETDVSFKVIEIWISKQSDQLEFSFINHQVKKFYVDDFLHCLVLLGYNCLSLVVPFEGI